ncbi:hypothetical protein ABW21_db0205825 [Orbilia brochopaga]|nr:hypothetical protein ABW21_db0205825 [Drechslerella brochopaga]
MVTAKTIHHAFLCYRGQEPTHCSSRPAKPFYADISSTANFTPNDIELRLGKEVGPQGLDDLFLVVERLVGVADNHRHLLVDGSKVHKGPTDGRGR